MTLTEIKDIWVGNSSLLPGSIHGVPQLAMNASPARQPGKGSAGSREPGQREKKEKKKKPNPEKKKGWILPNCALEWKSFYSCLLLHFSCSFSHPSSRLWVSGLESAGWLHPTLPALPGLQVGLGLMWENCSTSGMFISQSVPWELGQTPGLAMTPRKGGWSLPESAEEQTLAVGDSRIAVFTSG